MAEMKALLSFMDAEDRLKVMRRYECRFDAAGRDGDAALIKELGSPVRQVLMVEREYREREEAGLPGIADEEIMEEEPAAEESVSAEAEEASEDEQAREAEAALLVMEKLLSDDTQEELLAQEEVSEEESPAEEPYEEVEEDDEVDEPTAGTVTAGAPGTGRVIGAVALTPLMIVLALVGVALTAVLTAIGVLPGLGLGAAAVYLALYAMNSMSFLPDILLVSGAAIVALALCIFFLWLGIWLLVEGITLTIRLISRVYGKVLRKGGADNE